METVIQGSTLHAGPARHRPRAWRGRLRGGEPGVEPGRLSAARTVVVAGGAPRDGSRAFRPRRGLGVGVMATGHGVGAACDGGS